MTQSRVVTGWPAVRGRMGWLLIAGLLGAGSASAEPAPANAEAAPAVAAQNGAPPRAEGESQGDAAGENNPSLAVIRDGAVKRLSDAERARLAELDEDTLLALLNAPVDAQHTPVEQAIKEAFHKEAFEQTLKYRTGQIEVGDGLATLSLGDLFRYLDPADTEKLLVQGWGNPPGQKSLGMIVPKDESPLEEGGWAVVITYSEDGHVDDEDAEDIDYDELLAQMKEGTAEESKQRVSQGYESMALVGWAEPPRYDAATHRLYWAKELKFGDAPENTLNYAIRVLGRKGVLELNAVAGMSQLATVRGEMQRVLPLAEFKTGQSYADFNPDVDEVAAYGIGGLIAGKALAKVGFFAAALKILLAMKKFLVLGVVAIGALVAKLLRGRRDGASETP